MNDIFSSPLLNSFSDINKQLYKLAKEDAEQNGLTVVQLKTLYQVSSKPNIGLVELAENLKLTNSTVSGVVDRLVNSGLLDRKIAQKDRRAVTIHLTAEGEQKLQQIVKEDSLLVQQLLDIEQQFTELEIQQLIAMHKKIYGILSQSNREQQKGGSDS